MITISVKGVPELVASFDAAGAGAAEQAGKVIRRGALNVKRAMVADARASAHFKGFAPAISYDTKDGGLSAEIGPRRGKPGSLANIAYFGTSRGGGTVRDPVEALMDEEPNILRELGKITERILR